ncbi:MAG: family 14 glycosylhydrolase [Elusimicrobia bacterium]|nr:family 14 glycosylhydrolase [Elusimicrobiota bacterium]
MSGRARRGNGRSLLKALLPVFLCLSTAVPNAPFLASALAQSVESAQAASAATSGAQSGASVTAGAIAPIALALAPTAPVASLNGVQTALASALAPALAPAAAAAADAPARIAALGAAAPSAAPITAASAADAQPLGPSPRQPAGSAIRNAAAPAGAPKAARARPSGAASQDGRFLFDGDKTRGEPYARPDAAMGTLPGRRTSLGELAPSAQVQQVYVMGSLLDIQDWDAFGAQLKTLKDNGVAGITSDLWWGKFEKNEGRYDWSYYKRYADAVRAAGLKWVPILSFHRCGGNVGDNCNQPVPSWVWKSATNPDDMKFVDEKGFVDDEYVAFWNQDVYKHYDAAMASFAQNFASDSDIIPKIELSLGPAGELRYPSYNLEAGWKFPERGRLQAYSAPARSDFRRSMTEKYGGDLGRLNAAWGTALKSFDEVQPPGDGDRFFRDGAKTPYGRDFLGWYQGVLERHLDRMLELAGRRLHPTFGAGFGVKLAGVHWLYDSPDMPHAAERAAGYFDYGRLIDRVKKFGAELIFTCIEMDDSLAATAPFYSAPHALAAQIAGLARSKGVPLHGENALPISGETGYRNVSAMMAAGYGSFTLLRIEQIVDAAGRPTALMAPFVRDVVLPAQQRVAPAAKRNLAAIATAPAAGAAKPIAAWLTAAHYGVFAAACGWAANSVFLFFPWVQIAENRRNMRALKAGGDAAAQASQRLAGVSVGSQLALVVGNLFNFPSFLASGSPALIANALVGAAGSLIILTQLAAAGRVSRTRWALTVAASVASALAAPLLLAHGAAVSALGIAAAAVFAAFPLPQILQNSKLVAAARGTDAQARATALEKLRGVKPLYLLVGLVGNLLLVPVFMASGRWYNVVGCAFGVTGPLVILAQLARAGLLPKPTATRIAAGAALWSVLAIAASVFAGTSFWR